MITPVEIEKKVFGRQLRGYNMDEVDDFLNVIIADLEELTNELETLRLENDVLKAENEEHKQTQRSVIHTLDSAKRLMKEISESAEKRADIIIRNAKLDAEMIVNDAKDYVARYGGDGMDLKEKVAYFRSRYKQMLQDELADLEEKSTDLLSDLEMDFFPESFVETIPEHRAEDRDVTEEGLSSPEAEFAAIEAQVQKKAEEALDDDVIIMDRQAFDTVQPQEEAAEEIEEQEPVAMTEVPEEVEVEVPEAEVAVPEVEAEVAVPEVEPEVTVPEVEPEATVPEVEPEVTGHFSAGADTVVIDRQEIFSLLAKAKSVKKED